MTIVIEIAPPFFWKPGWYRSEVTVFRFWWLFFAVSIHRVSLAQMVRKANTGELVWEN